MVSLHFEKKGKKTVAVIKQLLLSKVFLKKGMLFIYYNFFSVNDKFKISFLKFSHNLDKLVN